MGTAAWYELYLGLQYLGNRLKEMWALLTTSPQSFKGGGIWNIITTINGVLGAIGTALLVLFFTIGVIKTCGSFAELKRPETAVKVFIRFAISKFLIDTMDCLFKRMSKLANGAGPRIYKKYVIGFTSREIATQEGTTFDEVRKCIYRALPELHKIFVDLGVAA